MKKETTEKFIKTIKDCEDKFKTNKIFLEFEKTSIEFEKLVKSGLIKKRGNNSQSIIETTSNSVSFNSELSDMKIL